MFNAPYVNKIHVDSRYRLPSSRSTSDFSIELAETISIGENVGAVVTDVCIPKTWYNITSNNNKLYLRYTISSVTTDKIIALPIRNYNIYQFRDKLQELLDIARASTFTVVADTSNGSIIISTGVANLTFKIFSDNELLSRVGGTWSGPFYTTQDLDSINDILRNTDLSTPSYSDALPYTSGFVDLSPIHAIYITSNKLNSYQNIGPRNNRNILKKVLVKENFGETINYEWLNPEDYTDISGTSLKILDFRLETSDGTPIDLNGAYCNFSICFVNIR